MLRARGASANGGHMRILTTHRQRARAKKSREFAVNSRTPGRAIDASRSRPMSQLALYVPPPATGHRYLCSEVYLEAVETVRGLPPLSPNE